MNCGVSCFHLMIQLIHGFHATVIVIVML